MCGDSEVIDDLVGGALAKRCLIFSSQIVSSNWNTLTASDHGNNTNNCRTRARPWPRLEICCRPGNARSQFSPLRLSPWICSHRPTSQTGWSSKAPYKDNSGGPSTPTYYLGNTITVRGSLCTPVREQC